MRENKGITLIALVVTIIILLILAGVTLNLVAGSDGILNKATKAVTINEIATNQEEIELAVLEKRIEYYNNYEENKDKDLVSYLKEELNNYKTPSGAILTVDEIGNIKYNDVIMATIDEKGKITLLDKDNIIPEENDPNKVKGAYYVYYRGQEYKEQAGEWENNSKVAESSIGKLEKQGDCMLFEAEQALSVNPACTKAETMNISEYDRINIEMEIVEEKTSLPNRNISIVVLNNSGIVQENESIYFPNQGKIAPNIGEKVTISMEISDMNNLNDVYFGVAIHGYKIKIYSIYLEKYKKEIKNLYHFGQENSKMGGEWINNPLNVSEFAKGTLTKESDHMLFKVNATEYTNPFCSNSQLIDITDYDKLKADIEVVSTVGNGYRNLNLAVKDTAGNRFKTKQELGAGGYPDSIGERKTITLDISEVTNNQTYVGIDANGYTFKIYRVWLEKIIQ